MISRLKRLLKSEEGITALETAIILIALVVVAAVFVFTALSAGMFSPEKGKEAIYSGISEVAGSLEVKGSIIATRATSDTIDSVVFTVSNVAGGEPVNMDADDPGVIIQYRDKNNRETITGWTVDWLGTEDDDELLEEGELVEITVPIAGTVALGPSTSFAIEIKPLQGSALLLERTTPAYFDPVMDLH